MPVLHLDLGVRALRLAAFDIPSHLRFRPSRRVAAPRGKSGGNLALRICAGIQGGIQGVANRKALIDDFFDRGSCFGLDPARGIFLLKYIFGDSGLPQANLPGK
jgi:hypothetical protein